MDKIVIPDRVGYVVGRRAWNIAQPGYLMSMSFQYVWTPGKAAVAKCKGECDEVPNCGCSCGFYAFNYRLPLSQFPGWPDCVGEVALWGGVVEHEGGYRGQYAYPLKVILDREYAHGDPERVAQQIAENYRIPVALGNLRAAISQGRQVTEEA